MTLSTLFRRKPRAELELAPPVVDDSGVVAAPLPPFCRDRAASLTHKYAAFGTTWALLPVPMATSAGLALLETHLIYWIARIYGEHPKKTDVLMTAAGLELASVALKALAMEGVALVPGVGLGVKAGIAGSVVEALGLTITRHYEEKYPSRRVSAD